MEAQLQPGERGRWTWSRSASSPEGSGVLGHDIAKPDADTRGLNAEVAASCCCQLLL